MTNLYIVTFIACWIGLALMYNWLGFCKEDKELLKEDNDKRKNK